MALEHTKPNIQCQQGFSSLVSSDWGVEQTTHPYLMQNEWSYNSTDAQAFMAYTAK